MSSSFGLCFFIRKSKEKEADEFTVFIRITVNGTRCEISTQRKFKNLKWNAGAGRLAGKGELIKEYNAYLDTLQQKIFEAKRQLIEKGEMVTAAKIKNIYVGRPEEKEQHLLLKIFLYHNTQIELLAGQEYSVNTLKKYRTTYHHTKEFLKEKYGLDDIEVEELKFEFITEFQFWLKVVHKCNHNSTIKYLTNFRKIINRCLKNGWLVKDPFYGFSMAKKEVERVALTEFELKTIEKKEFGIERLAMVKDIFLFSCYSGLAYADVLKLKRSDIIIGIDGTEWISIRRQKTDTSSRIPLLPPALRILEFYKDHPQCKLSKRILPVLSNQKMNSYLKEIADGCSIIKTLTYHIARHTFATTVTLCNGVPIETVSKMLGHKDLRTTQHYAKILDKKISDDMQFLKTKFS